MLKESPKSTQPSPCLLRPEGCSALRAALLKLPAADGRNSAIPFLTHLSDYRLSHFGLFFPVQLLSWQSRTIAWNTYRNNTNSRSSSLRGRRRPYLEMPRVWRLRRAPKGHKGRAGSWTLVFLAQVFFFHDRMQFPIPQHQPSLGWVSVAQFPAGTGRLHWPQSSSSLALYTTGIRQIPDMFLTVYSMLFVLKISFQGT